MAQLSLEWPMNLLYPFSQDAMHIPFYWGPDITYRGSAVTMIVIILRELLLCMEVEEHHTKCEKIHIPESEEHISDHITQNYTISHLSHKDKI